MKKKDDFSFLQKLDQFWESGSLPATTSKILLMVVGGGLLIAGAAVVPGVLKALEAMKYDSKNNIKKNELGKRSQQQIRDSLWSLKKQKLIKVIKEKNGKTWVKLTNKGEKRIKEFILDTMSITKPPQWDGIWRVVIFDIPNDKNSARMALRLKLKKLGFKQLQKSVWIFPYECEDKILFIAETFEVVKYIEVLKVKSFLHEKQASKVFKLK